MTWRPTALNISFLTVVGWALFLAVLTGRVELAVVAVPAVVALTQATRVDPRVTLGASPRGSLALLKLAREEAAIRGRDFVLPDDVKAVAVAALAHRLVLRPELWVSSTTPRHVVDGVLREVPAPAGEPA